MRQQVGFIADQNGMLLLALVQAHDSAGNLAHQVAAEVRRLQRRRVPWCAAATPAITGPTASS